MRARAPLIAFALLAAFAGVRVATGGFSLSSFAASGTVEAEGPARLLAPVSGLLAAGALGQGAGNAPS